MLIIKIFYYWCKEIISNEFLNTFYAEHDEKKNLLKYFKRTYSNNIGMRNYYCILN